MVGIGGIGAKGYNGLERFSVAAFCCILGYDVICNLLFRNAFLQPCCGPFHHQIVDAGGLPHQILLHAVLAGLHGVHTVRRQHTAASGQAFHQRKQEHGRPLLINAKGLAAVHLL